MSIISRRDFLLGTTAGALALNGPATWARGAGGDRLVVIVELRGGNDGLNTLVPFEDEVYQRARPRLALGKKDVLPIADGLGLHASLERTARRFANGGVAIVQGVGHDRTDLSHFRGQDFWGAGSTALTLPSTGWLGRACEAGRAAPDPPLARIAVGVGGVPHALRGEYVACAVPSLNGYGRRHAPAGVSRDELRARRRALDALNAPSALRHPDPILARATEAAEAARLSMDELQRVRRVKAARYPNSKLAADLRLIAGAVTAGLPVRAAHVTLDGFDTHTSQRATHPALLAELDAALDAFLTDMQARGYLDRTLVLTVSEFGRRVRENGIGDTAGTDHGAASMAFLLGGRVHGGVYGTAPALDALDADGNLPYTTDFRRLYATVTERWLGVDPKMVLGEAFEPLEVIS